jgi:hypothetical protein
MIHTRWATWIAVAWVLAMNGTHAAAQSARDPTLAPPETGSASALGTPMASGAMSVMMRGERAYLVVGTRLYAPGDKVGDFRVDRITETQVWLHDGTKLIKLPRFAGIERKSLAPEPRCAAPDTQHNVPAAGAPCEDTQP